MLRGGGGVFEGWLAVGHCVEYLMQVSPAHRVHTRRNRLVLLLQFSLVGKTHENFCESINNYLTLNNIELRGSP